MHLESTLILAVVVFGYAMVSKWLAQRSISGPFVFVVLGTVLGSSLLGWVGGDFRRGGIQVLAEATLVLILFVDATRLDLRALREQLAIPARLLGIGLPLTIGAGALLGAVVLTDLTLFEAALLAAILTPTDAALGQAVISDKRVPVRIRQGLNVESGLNDGLMLPVITILIAFAASKEGLESPGYWLGFASRQVGFGVLIGLAIGAAGGVALDSFVRRGWVEGALRQLATLAVAVSSFAAAGVAGGNGFVAAFVAGLAFGWAAQDHCGGAADFTEDEGQLLALLTFFFFGALMVGPHLGQLTWSVALYAVLSLTAVRMIPVALSLIGMQFEAMTIAYLGWFGPRGLASILFGLFAVESADFTGSATILAVVTWTCVASIVLHGLTAVPFAAQYGAWLESKDAAEQARMPEFEEVAEMRTRLSQPSFRTHTK